MRPSLTAVLLLIAPVVVAATPTEPVAIVAHAEGDISACSAPCSPVSGTIVGSFNWLSSGTRLEVGSDASIVLLFRDGSRFEIIGKAVVDVQDNGVQHDRAFESRVRRLEPMPPLPSILPLAASERSARRLGAIRIRALSIEDIYPEEHSSTLADQTTISFAAVENASTYDIEILDRIGRKAFSIETAETRVVVPPDVLRPGEPYLVKIRTVDHPVAILRGESEFWTLPEADARARDRLAEALRAGGDPGGLLLLAEIDRGLGLMAQAREASEEAIAMSALY